MRFSVKLCFIVLAAYFAAAVYGEVQYRIAHARDVTPSYNVVNTEARYMPPSAEHWLGTDNLGRDVGLRLVQGARIAFHVGIMTSLIAIPLGVLLGLLGGYFGGKVDSIVVWLCATVASMPGLLSSSRSRSSSDRACSASTSASASRRGWASAARSARR